MRENLNKFFLNNKVAYVCGGLGLIGREITRTLSQSGAEVIILDIDRTRGKIFEKELRTTVGKVHFEFFDITQLPSMEKNLKSIIEKFNRIDIWVNASYPRTKDWGNSLENLKLESLRKNIDMQLNSCLWSSRIVALSMKQQKIAGSIINLGSIYGVQANDFTVYEGTSIQSPMAYSAIKGGVVNFTRYLASYFGKFNIRANSVCPGGIFDHQNKRFVRNYNHKVPLRRMGTPQEVAAAVLFLASDASSYITGSALMVDGGWTII